MKTRIISAFPSSGKTYLATHGWEGNTFMDSDSSSFSWLADGITRNPEFPSNYISHIKSNIGKVDYILVSSHIDVRRALSEEGLCWSYVVPDKTLMAEWVGRCYLRGNPDGFIKALVVNWDEWTKNSLDPLPNALIKLKGGEYLTDRIGLLNCVAYN